MNTSLSSLVLCSTAFAVTAVPAVLVPTAAWAGTRPSCVKVSVRESSSAPFYSKEIATVRNGCTTTKHLKVVWHAGRDSSCLRVRPGRSVQTMAQLTVSHYDQTVTC
ncbi:MAG: hypothetical protein JWR42_2061 [Marmoricola sp.]|nr:hypothetical protein [Marmoricola sp.]